MPPIKDDIAALRNRISQGETTARAVVESSLRGAEQLNEELNAFLEVDRGGASTRAEEIDNSLWSSNGDGAKTPELAGIPIAIKDNICVCGMQTSCGSKILGNYRPPYN